MVAKDGFDLGHSYFNGYFLRYCQLAPRKKNAPNTFGKGFRWQIKKLDPGMLGRKLRSSNLEIEARKKAKVKDATIPATRRLDGCTEITKLGWGAQMLLASPLSLWIMESADNTESVPRTVGRRILSSL